MGRTDDLTPAERIKLVEEALAFHEAYWSDPRPGSGVPTLADALEALRGMEVIPGATQRSGGLFYYAEPRHPRDRSAALLTLRNGGDDED